MSAVCTCPFNEKGRVALDAACPEHGRHQAAIVPPPAEREIVLGELRKLIDPRQRFTPELLDARVRMAIEWIERQPS